MRYYIIAGERSGDLHGGNLVRSIREQDNQAIIKGFGGDDMQNHGVEITVHYSEMAFMGFVSLITSLGKIFKYLAICKKDILQFKPDAVILIDYGGFNLKIAKFAHVNGLKVFYYIPPKVWAWNQKRAWKLKAYTDRIFVILPFEKQFFKKFDLNVDYVGNPVLDAVKTHQSDSEFLDKYGFDTNRKLIALLPGSRKIELTRIVPLMAKIAEKNKDFQFAVASVSNLPSELYQDLKNIHNVKFVEGDTYNLLQHAHAAIVTSGTATLETALYKVPQVVVYKTSGIEYTIASNLVQVKYISLVNLICDKEVVKELIQTSATLINVDTELNRLIHDENYRSKIKTEYDQLYKKLDTGSASANTARLMVGYLNKKN